MSRIACFFAAGALLCGCLPHAAAIDMDSVTATQARTDEPDSAEPTDSATEAPSSQAPTDTDERLPDALGNSSGGGVVSSKRYELRLTVGGPPMADIASKRHRARLGVGAALKP